MACMTTAVAAATMAKLAPALVVVLRKKHLLMKHLLLTHQPMMQRQLRKKPMLRHPKKVSNSRRRI